MRRRDDKFPDNGFEAWGGYMQAKIAKLEEQYVSTAVKEKQISDIFNGVSIYVNGFTVPSAEELKVLMANHGGVYHTYQRSDDYIIASNLPDTKVKNMSLTKVVKPEWLTDSIAASCLLNYRDYLLYKNSRTQPQLNFNKTVKNDLVIENKTDTSNSCNESAIKEKVNVKTEDPKCPKQSMEDNVPQYINSPNIFSIPTTNAYNISIPEDSASTDMTNEVTKQRYQGQQVTKTAADPNFISEFYNNSRLHHISQLGACFKQHVNELREKSNFVFPYREELKKKIIASNGFSQLQFEKGKIIMHIDMDCFFVSVGLRNRPDLMGKPIAVTHSKGGQARPKRPGVDRNTEFKLYKQKQAKKLGKASGTPEEEVKFESRVDNITDEDDKYGSMSEIASCSYEARAKGIGNGMFMGAALRLCPDLQTIPYDFEGYKEVAYSLYNTIAKYTLDIEAVSCDEMYVDCTNLLKDMNVSVQDFATVLRNEIKNKTGCPCSTGFGGNRLQARLATKKAKPDGQFFLTADLVEDFMFDIKLKDLPGVGRQTAQKLESLGHMTCGSLQNLSLASLKCHLGNKTGAQLFDQCRGRDLNPLIFHNVRKSVSAEVNYGIRFDNNDQCLEFLKQLSAEVHLRMDQFKVLGKCITLKLMVRAEEAPVETAKFMGHGFCNVINKSSSLNNATNDVEIITKEVISLCKKQNIDPKEMRGIGIQVTKLEAINSKPTRGAMNKFLCKTIKPETKHENYFQTFDEDSTLQDAFIKTKQIVENKAITPSKQIESTVFKSPVKGQVKSPGKRRGRPPNKLRVQQSSSKNLISKFLQGQSVKDTPYKDPMVRETGMNIIKDTFKDARVNAEYKEPMIKEEEPVGLLGLPWEKVRELLRAWLESGQTPLPCDINLISTYMRDMVIKRNLEKLNILVNFLRRRTRELDNKNWRDVYDKVIEEVQNAMIYVYGKKLWIEN